MYIKSFNTINLNILPAQANNCRLLLSIFGGVLLFISISSCSKNNDEEPTPDVKSGEASISKISFTVDGENHDASISEEVVTVNLSSGTIPSEVTVATLEHSPEANPSVKQGEVLMVSDGKATITVTAEDGKTNKTFTINFVAQPFSGTSVSKISFTVDGKNYDASISEEVVTVNLPAGTTIPSEVTITSFIHSPKAIATASQGDVLTVKEEKATITVTAEDGKTTKTYTINFIAQHSSEALITSLVLEVSGDDKTKVKPITFDQDDNASVELPYGTTQVKIIILEHSANAVPSVSEENILDIANDQATITITAQDGTTTETYTINFDKLPASTEALITSLVLGIPSGNDKTIDFMQGTTASVIIPYGTTVPATVNVKTLTYSAEAESSVDQGNNLTITDDEAEITITAQDGTTTKTYTIHFIPQLRVSFDLNGGTSTSTIDPIIVEKGGKVSMPIIPDDDLTPPDGKSFGYWATSEVSNADYGNDKFDFDATAVDADITLYAVWKEKPTNKTALQTLINAAIRDQQDESPNLNFIDTGLIMDMSELFKGYKTFNGNISEWNTSQVITMEKMFNNAEAFDGDISEWNTSQVNNMAHMFNNAKVFNQDIGDWNTGEVTDMQAMFFKARAFNQDIGDWDMRKVTITSWMFLGATAFNGNIQKWNTENIKEMNGMFIDTYAFKQDISGWTVAQVTTFTDIFRDSGIEDNHKPMKFR